MQIQFSRIILQMIDEHSMNDSHRCKEARRPVNITDKGGSILVHGQSSLPKEVYSRPWSSFNSNDG